METSGSIIIMNGPIVYQLCKRGKRKMCNFKCVFSHFIVVVFLACWFTTLEKNSRHASSCCILCCWFTNLEKNSRHASSCCFCAAGLLP